MSVSSWATPPRFQIWIRESLVGTVIVAVIVAVPVSVIVSLPVSRRHGGCTPCGTGVSRRHIGKCPVLSVMGSDQR